MNTKQIDFDKARKTLGIPHFLVFSEYSPAYCATNEDLRAVIGFSDVKNSRVLTVAGSGDSPIFYRIAGAKSIDTFDLSYCAKVVMDIKTSAVSVLEHPEYIEMILSLYNSKGTNQISHFEKINDHLSSDVKNFLSEMDGCRIFKNGLNPRSYQRYMPTATEYSKMQQMIKQPFEFKWSDISNIHTELHGHYDIINLSNVFQYIKSAETISEILENLGRHLTPTGIIVAETTWFFSEQALEKYIEVQNNLRNHAKLGVMKHAHQQSMIVKHR